MAKIIEKLKDIAKQAAQRQKVDASVLENIRKEQEAAKQAAKTATK
jgi:hypothetical protein